MKNSGSISSHAAANPRQIGNAPSPLSSQNSGRGQLGKKYFSQVAAGKLSPDDGQIAVLPILDGLLAEIQARQTGWRVLTGRISEAWQLRRRPAEGDDLSTGSKTSSLYLYGSVGRGKSMLMDYFFALASEPRKRRVHFHQFMRDIFAELEANRAAAAKADNDDPLISVCRRLAEQTRLLCFDEFVVTSIAEAMILGRLIGALLDFGVVVVATSNFHPENLYQGGLHRDRFLPFIAMMTARFTTVNLTGDIDWRGREAEQQTRVLPHWLGLEDSQRFNAIWQQKCGGFVQVNQRLTVLGRDILVPQSGHAQGQAVARFGFGDLCLAHLGPSDYLAITAAYRCLFISDIPILYPEQSEAARRFLTLIDALYEAKTELFATAAAPVKGIFAHIPENGPFPGKKDENLGAILPSLARPPKDIEGDVASKALASNRDNPDQIASDKTEFSRAISRLVALTG
ncbi:MAG: cell division protein ZapE [Candidatus Symbiobacter sp.]|nr:cell division protein ZapE [Candidatus Symbiobacter sp.]